MPIHYKTLELWLQIGEEQYPLLGVDPMQVKLRTPLVKGVLPCWADLIIVVDGRPESSSVWLHDGIQAGAKSVYYSGADIHHSVSLSE